MDILADTHIILWSFFEPEKLSSRAQKIISDKNNLIYYSTISMWEVAIKHNRKKLAVSGTEFLHYCEQAGFIKLPFDDRHIIALENLEKKEGAPEHNDPFDNALLAQAKADNLLLLTHDSKFLVFDEPYYSIV